MAAFRMDYLFNFFHDKGNYNQLMGAYSGVVRQEKILTTAMNSTTTATNKVAEASKKAGISVSSLALRAIQVIPIWMALRGAYMAVIGTFQDGVKYIIDLDKAMARMGAVVQGVGDKAQFMKKLQDAVKELSINTGKNVTEISEIFYRFAETGLDAESSLAGMQTAAKLATATFEDTGEVARILVDMYNLLGDTITDAVTPMEKMETIAGTFMVLWKENAGNLGEYIEGLKTFTSTAKQMGLNMKQTLTSIAVLNTFMSRGSVGGTQLARALMEVVQNSDKVALALGKTRDEIMDMTPWERFVALLKEFKNNVGNTQVIETMTEIFGERAVKGAGALSIGLQKLIDSLDKIGSMGAKDFSKVLNDAFEAQVDTLDIQLKRMDELKKQTVETFVTSAAGATNFLDALKNINAFIEEKLMPAVEEFGAIFHNITGPSYGMGYIREKFMKGFDSLNTGNLPIQQSDKDMFFKLWLDKYKQLNAEGKYKALQEIGMSAKDAYSTLDFNEQKKLRASQKIEAKIKADVDTIENQVNTKSAEAAKEQESAKKDYYKLAKASLEYELQQTELLKTTGASQLEIEQAKLDIMLKRNDTLKDEEAILKQIIKVQDEANKELIKYTEAFNSALKDMFTQIQGGNIQEGLKGFTDSIIGQYRDTVSDIASKLVMSSGLGEAFGGALSSLKQGMGGLAGKISEAHILGINQGAQVIIAAHKTGMSGGISTPGSFLTSGKQDVGGNINLASMFNTSKNPYSGYMGSQKSSYPGGYAPAGYKDPTSGGISGGQIIGAGMNIAMGAMSGYQTGGAAGAAMGGIGAGLMMIPHPAAQIAGLALTLGSSLLGLGKVKKESQEERRSFQVTSRIDVTNKQLEVVNRNLVALRQELTYILPESAYFSEKRGIIEDEFSLHARRGIV